MSARGGKGSCEAASDPADLNDGAQGLMTADVLVNKGTAAVLGFRHQFKPDCSIKITHKQVLCCGIVMPNNAADAPGGAGLDQAVKHGLLQLALEGAAAHDPQVDVQRVALHLANEGRNQAVVAKFVDQTSIQGDVVRVI